MTHEEAKIILQAYQPLSEGEEAHDLLPEPLLTEALELTRTDAGLGQWFTAQCSFDETMRAALQMEMPPARLRDSILLAGKNNPTSQNVVRLRRYFPMWGAWAAALVMLLSVAFFLAPRIARVNPPPSMSVASFARQVLDIKEHTGITLGKISSDPAQLRTWLAERGAPHDFVIPSALRNIPAAGCQSYMLGGVKVSLICFIIGKDQIVHLFVVNQGVLKDAPLNSLPQFHGAKELAFATWTSGGKCYVLTGDHVSQETLQKLI
jgi:hypothetical protein